MNGYSGDLDNPTAITASFDMTALNYFPNVFNTDPLKIEEKGFSFCFLQNRKRVYIPVKKPKNIGAEKSPFDNSLIPTRTAKKTAIPTK